MRPAARQGDLGTPIHAPPTLSIVGPGCTNVEIQNQRAWRAGDFHGGSTGTCKGPPPTVTHGLEACRMGSLTVLINGQMAVCMGDVLLGAGPPNAITGGAPKVMIGDVAFGLAKGIDEF